MSTKFHSNQSCTPSTPQSLACDTHFAPAERKTGSHLDHDINIIVADPLITGLMEISNGLFAVLNDARQVIALNESFLKLMGIEDIDQVLGLRPGEYVQCVHACDMPGGCGTSEYCSTCGAVVSIMTAMDTRQPQERTCALTVEKDYHLIDLYFNVRSCPVTINNSLYVLFFMQDVSIQQHSSCLERSFFHDINNVLCALSMKSESLATGTRTPEKKAQEVHQLVSRIAQEVAIQHALRNSLDSSYSPIYAHVAVSDILNDIQLIFADHPLTKGRTIDFKQIPDSFALTTDLHLVSRIVVNMLTNALEATHLGGSVQLDVVSEAHAVSFKVWNNGVIADDVAKRIFQRNFSTKGTLGRGLGTFSMKLFGEKILGGTVRFETSADEGTTFILTIADKQ